MKFVIALLLSVVPAAAQNCAAALRYVGTPCSNAICHGTRVNTIIDDCPVGSETCYGLERTAADCCGINYYYFTPNGSCTSAFLRDKRVQMQVLALAKTHPILVPTCEGGFVPAVIAFREEHGN